MRSTQNSNFESSLLYNEAGYDQAVMNAMFANTFPMNSLLVINMIAAKKAVVNYILKIY